MNISQIKVGDTTYDIADNDSRGKLNNGELIHYVQNPTGIAAVTSKPYYAARWSGTCPGVTELYTGLTVQIKIPVAGNGSYGVVLNINETGEHPVVVNVNSYISTRYGVGCILTLTYDADQVATAYINSNSASNITGCWKMVEYDSTNIYQLKPGYGIYTLSADLKPYGLLLQKDETTLVPVNSVGGTGNTKTLTTEEFNPFGMILYFSLNASYTAGTTNPPVSYLYRQVLFDLRYSFNTATTLTANKDVYIVAEVQSNGMVKLSSSPISLQLPATDDGKIYIYLGHSYDTYRVELHPVHPAYWYKDGNILLYTGAKYENKSAASGGTETSLVTTGEKYIWNNKLNAITSSTNLTAASINVGGNGSNVLLDNGTLKAIGAANGLATLDGTGKVPSSQLPSYIDDVVEGYYFPTDGNFYNNKRYTPGVIYSGLITGETGKIYIDLESGKCYRWTGSVYVEISSSDVTSIKLGESGTSYTPTSGTITLPIYAGGTAVTLNGVSKTENTASFYAPTSSGTAGQLLVSGGSDASPTFRSLVAADIPSITKSKISDFPASMPASDVYTWAKASTKPSYNFSEIGSKPTTISGYGITDAKIASGVITLGSNTITPLTAHLTIYALTFKNSSGTTVDTYAPATSPAKTVKAGNNVTIGAESNTITISATDTTYESKAAASGGTAVSLVTTGEKYTWNNKLSNVAKLGSTTKPVYTSAAGTFAECSTYAGGTAVTLNGTSKAASTASFYAPTTVGTAGQVLVSLGSGAPEWQTANIDKNFIGGPSGSGTDWKGYYKIYINNLQKAVDLCFNVQLYSNYRVYQFVISGLINSSSQWTSSLVYAYSGSHLEVGVDIIFGYDTVSSLNKPWVAIPTKRYAGININTISCGSHDTSYLYEYNSNVLFEVEYKQNASTIAETLGGTIVRTRSVATPPSTEITTITSAENSNTSGALTFDGKQKLYDITLTGDVTGITLTANPNEGEECKVILNAGSSARNVTVPYNSSSMVTTNGANMSFLINSGAFAELLFTTTSLHTYVKLN